MVIAGVIAGIGSLLGSMQNNMEQPRTYEDKWLEGKVNRYKKIREKRTKAIGILKAYLGEEGIKEFRFGGSEFKTASEMEAMGNQQDVPVNEAMAIKSRIELENREKLGYAGPVPHEIKLEHPVSPEVGTTLAGQDAIREKLGAKGKTIVTPETKEKPEIQASYDKKPKEENKDGAETN